MKKALVFIFAFILLLTFSACGSEGNETTSEVYDVTTQTEKSTAEEKSTEEATTKEAVTEEETTEEAAGENTVTETSDEIISENEEGSNNEETAILTLPIDEDGLEMSFLSGAGGWRTELIIYPDGSFSGQYSDSEMGSNGADYPNGTVYICDFSGKFSDITKTSDTSFSMTLNDISLKYETGKEWIEDSIRYIASTPYGLEGGKDFIFYLPDASLSQFDDEFLLWWPLKYEHNDTPFEALSCYSIRNLATEEGFFSY